jgi:hypothetical protein
MSWSVWVAGTTSAEAMTPPAPQTDTDFATTHNCARFASRGEDEPPRGVLSGKSLPRDRP